MQKSLSLEAYVLRVMSIHHSLIYMQIHKHTSRYNIVPMEAGKMNEFQEALELMQF